MFRRYLEMRYIGQSFELTVPAPADGLRDGQLHVTLETFHREHQRAYGFAAPDEPTEVVTLRVAAVGRMPRPRLSPLPAMPNGTPEARSRPVYFAEANGFVPCSVYNRY